MKKILIMLAMFLLTGFLFVTPSHNPEKTIDDFYKSIEVAKQKGNYNCCIEPDCTMCYFGNWKFEKGTCFCDNAIAKGDFDSVCPQCKKGVGDAQCDSTKEIS